jgi:hypothetical protein
MHANVPNHEPSLMLMNCGDQTQVRPSVGSWVTYGLGTENQNLPGFIAMCPGGYPIKDTENWQAAFLPGAYQGTYIDSQHTDIDKLIANIRNSDLSPRQQRRQLDLVQELNRRHAEKRQNDRPRGRIHSLGWPARGVRPPTPSAYGNQACSRFVREERSPQILIARRLVERDVDTSSSGTDRAARDGRRHQVAMWLAGDAIAIAALIRDLSSAGCWTKRSARASSDHGRAPSWR